MDRDGKFTQGFCEILQCEGVEAVKLPPQSPNLTPHIERFMRSIKEEALARMLHSLVLGSAIATLPARFG